MYATLKNYLVYSLLSAMDATIDTRNQSLLCFINTFLYPFVLAAIWILIIDH